jgi:hypothetical protein
VTADHQRRREWPGLAGDVAHIPNPDPRFLEQFARDRRFEILADLDETGEGLKAAGRIMRLAPEQQLAVMFGEHDHDGIHAREMLGPAGWATSRPPTSDRVT